MAAPPTANRRRYRPVLVAVFAVMSAGLLARALLGPEAALLRLGVDLVFALIVVWIVWRYGTDSYDRRRALEDRLHVQEDRSAELEAFAARIAHDIRGPLGIAYTGCELARKKYDPPGLRDLMERNLRGLKRANAIIEGLLAFARSGAHPEMGGATDVQAVTGDFVLGLQPEAEAAGVDLVSGDLPAVWAACSEGVFLSILGNLARNAIKYLDGMPTRRVELRVVARSGRIRLEVSDTGPGISPEHLGALFDPYFRVGGSRREGLGLGLATVKRLVDQHGGTVTVASVVGQGTTFTVELPEAAAPPALLATATPASRSH